ncbi:MAG: hypothetical protein WBW78_19985 [Terrimicrobiaceae bacterium]
MKLKDIGLFLREGIETYFAAQEIPVVVRYFDPSYQVRSRPANCEDAVLCDVVARHAAHTAMAGKTGLVIGFLHDRLIHVPIEFLAAHTKRLDPASGWWRSVFATTGQPERFAWAHDSLTTAMSAQRRQDTRSARQTGLCPLRSVPKGLVPVGRGELKLRLQPMVERTSFRFAFLLPNEIGAHRDFIVSWSRTSVRHMHFCR